MKKKVLKFISVFVITFTVFLALALFSDNMLIACGMLNVRLSAFINPVSGIAFGWPAILACAFANFVCDLINPAFGFQAAVIGLLPQIIYGSLPYYALKSVARSKAHITRLNTPGKTALFALLTAVNSSVPGLSYGIIRYISYGDGFFRTFLFCAGNYFCVCTVFAFPSMAVIDYIRSKTVYAKKRVLSVNEKIILWVAVIQIIFSEAAIIYRFFTKTYFETQIIQINLFNGLKCGISVIFLLGLGTMYFFSYKKKKHASLRIFKKKNGTIFVDEKRKTEFISYPGYGPFDSVKCDAYGYNPVSDGQKKKPSYENAWYVALSSQKGCSMKCSFCDCPAYGFYGNLTREDLIYQMETILNNTGSAHTKWLEVDFMRMGEPSFNPAVLPFIENDLRDIIRSKADADIIFPTLSTMLPRSRKDTLKAFLTEAARIKNEVYEGNMAIQLSLFSTDDSIRKSVFHSLSLTIPEISEIVKDMPHPKGRKYQLDFTLTENSVLDASVIDRYFDKEKFIIKLTPIRKTDNALANGCKITGEYSDLEIFKKTESDFLKSGWDVMCFPCRKDEDDDSLACGNLLSIALKDKISDKPELKKKIGIIVAIEIDAVFTLYKNIRELPAPEGFKLFETDNDNEEIFILQAGMGECASSAGVQYLISECKAEMIVNFGVVGGLTKDMKKQKVVLVNRVVHYKYDCHEFMDLAVGQVDGHDSVFLPTDADLIKKALAITPDIPLVTCASGDKFVSTQEEKEYLHTTFEGDICDMESSGIVLTCEANNVPCILFKAVSDGLADGAAGFYEELREASVNCLKTVNGILDKIAFIEK